MYASGTNRVLYQYYGSIMVRDESHVQRVSANPFRVILSICGSSQGKSVLETALCSATTTSQNTPVHKVNTDRDQFAFI